MSQPPPETDRPDQWLPPSQVPTTSGAAVPSAVPVGNPASHGGGRRRWLVALAVVLVSILAVTGIVALRGGSPEAQQVPSGELPAQPAVPSPPVVTALEERGLECVDEAYDPWLIKGCHLYGDQRIVTVRMKVDAAAGIEKFLVQVLDDTVSADARNAEFSDLLDVMLEAAEVPEADRQDVSRSVAADQVREFERIGWGELYLPAPQPETRTVILTRSDVVPPVLIARPVLGSYDAVKRALIELGYTCREANGTSFTCDGKRPGEEFSGAFHAGAVLTLSVWFEGPLPAADAPILTDAYAMLQAVADPHSEAFRQGLARMARGGSEQVFVVSCRILRWEQRLEIGSVDFA